ncbi:MAG: hypothetical protein F4X56_05610 [Gammaproteobacteria bacterium]|nr:hypothetical protein [Gammaproteobacteria bacterium]MYC25379.1 hypothetical protein [Gammaproteobacteria bacterium]
MLRRVLFGFCVAFFLVANSISGSTFNTFWNMGDFTVPADPTAHIEESEEHQDAWQQALKKCLPINRFEILEDEECLEALQRYFLNEPVWAYSILHYYDRVEGLKPLPVKLANSRPRILPYSYADFLTKDIPYWRDIFDGNLHRNISRFRQVTREDECMELSKQTSIGIQANLAKQCEARGMFKYATFLEACNVSMQQMLILINHPDIGGVFKSESSSGYEAALEVIEKEIEDGAQREIARQRLEKGFLHTIWLRYECEPWGYSLLPDSETPPPPKQPTTMTWNVSRDRMFQQINRTHDTLMKIAAKCGDSWAIQSFPLGIFTSSEFNDYVMERNPLLMHRHLGSHTGWFRSELTFTERLQHQAKAFLLLEESVGEKNARKEYDPIELEEAIEYVSEGGELKYARPLREILRAREERFDDEEDLILKESGFQEY